MPNTARIRELNDALRTCRDPIAAMSMNGSIIFTRAVVVSGQSFVNRVFGAVAAFNAFTTDDPHGEHDMGFLTVDGVEIFFKVDYYDPKMERLSSYRHCKDVATTCVWAKGSCWSGFWDVACPARAGSVVRI